MRFSTRTLLSIVFYAALIAVPVLIILNVDDNRLRRFVNETTGRVDCEETVQFTTDVPTTAYSARIQADVAELEGYWDTAFEAQWNRSFTNPCVVMEYDAQHFDYSDECGLNPETASRNAFYCGNVEGVFWDGPTFFHDIYAEIGPSAVTIILAHEYGHWVQDLSDAYPENPYNVEMQADCYAGAFLGAAIASGYLENTDIDEIIRIMARFGQPRWSGRWTEVTYGSALERNQAIFIGFDGGTAACQIDFAETFGDSALFPERRGFGNRR